MRRLWAGLALAATALLAGCAATPPTHPALARADAQGQLPPLVPARVFFANIDDHGSYRVSPDGRHLIWRAVRGTRSVLLVRPLDGPGTAERVVLEGGGDIRWAPDSRHLIVQRDQGGDENWHVYAIDALTEGAVLRDLTPHPGTRAHLARALEDGSGDIVVGHNRRDKTWFDLYRIHLASGRETLIQRNPGDTVGTLVDRQGRQLAQVRKVGEQGFALHALREGEPRGPELQHWRAHDDFVNLIGATEDGRGAYLLTNRGRERLVLARIDLASGEEQVLHADSDADVESVFLGGADHAPLAAFSAPHYQRVGWLDAALRRDVQGLLPAGTRRVIVYSASRDARLVTLQIDGDASRRHALLDRRGAQAQLRWLGDDLLAPWRHLLAPTRPVTITARDGLTLPGYLNEPPGVTGPGPLVLAVHGGPWARDHWDNGLGTAQFLANRGYRVLRVNYRGSTGYGRRHTEAAVGEFAGKMHEDLLDAATWAVAQGLADPQRIAITGASYGGYATLVGLTFTPERFACGVATVPPTDLVTLVEDFPPYWGPFLAGWYRYVGNPKDPAQRSVMAAKSPLNHVDALQKPLLIIQTAGDVRVRQDQSDRFVAAARAAGKRVDYITYGGAGHQRSSWGWARQLHASRASEDFLANCLGGRSAGFDLYEAAAWAFR